MTILFTDVEGSTAFRTRVSDAAGNQVMAAHERLVAEQVRQHDGRLVKSLGDGCLAVFASPRRALECAVAVQQATLASPLRVRMGLNAGEVTLTGNDVFGAAVNAAARIAAKAQGGEILVSDVVRQLMGSGSAAELRDRGRVRLRGFPERWRLHEVVWRDDGTTAGRPDLTPFVGRAAEIARLHRVLDNLATGRGAAVVIRGEAGIGKTRLATEALESARSRGWRILTGRASPFEGLGLEPIIEAFGSLLRGLDRPALDDLVGDLPHLARLFEGIGLAPAPAAADPALERTLLFESVTRLLERLARQIPTVLLIDDVQWADPASLELIHQLGRNIDRQPAALVLTYRPGEGAETERLRQLLITLRRIGVLEEIDLGRLDPPAVEAMAREFLGGRVPPSLLEILVRTAGTPLFVDSFLRGLVDRGQLTRAGDAWTLADTAIEVPTAVRDLILERLDSLEPEARRVVELISLTGAALGYDVLLESGELGPDALTGAIERLTAIRLLAEEVDAEDLAYRLAHPLYYEVAAGAFPEIARRRGHAVLALALERCRPSDLESLGRHYLGAGPALDRARALEVFTEAGERAAHRGAYVEAVRFFDAAVGLARQAEDDGRLPSLLEQVADARHRSGQTDAAVAAWTEALDLRDSAGEATAVARIHGALGIAEFDRGRLVDARQHHQVAARLLENEAPTAEHGQLHFARVTVLRRLGQSDELLDVARQLEEVAAALGTARARAQAHYARAAALFDTGALVDAFEHAREGLDWARQAGDDPVAYRLHTVCCDAASVLGDHRRLQEHSQEAWELIGTLGAAGAAGGAALYRMLAATLSGAWDDALAYSNELVEIARRVNNTRLTVSVLGTHAWHLALRGDLAEAEALMAEIGAHLDPAMRADRRAFGFISKAEARVAMERDQPDRALAALGEHDAPSDDLWVWMITQAEVRAGVGDLAGARRAVAALTARSSSPFVAAELAYAEGLIHRASNSAVEAATALARSVAIFEELDMPFHTARSRLERAAVLAASEPGAAIGEAERAHAVFERLPAKRYIERAQALLETLGVRPRPERPTSRREGPLSRREVEVALLVAEGLTNAEIAERLTVSVRTVTSHLDHIYTRLGINSRAALARHVATQPAAFPVAG